MPTDRATFDQRRLQARTWLTDDYARPLRNAEAEAIALAYLVTFLGPDDDESDPRLVLAALRGFRDAYLDQHAQHDPQTTN